MMTVKTVIISTLYVFCPFNPYDMLRNVICHGEITNNYFNIIIAPYFAGVFHLREWFCVACSVIVTATLVGKEGSSDRGKKTDNPEGQHFSIYITILSSVRAVTPWQDFSERETNYPIWTVIRTPDIGVSWVMGDAFPRENLRALYSRKATLGSLFLWIEPRS